MSLFTIWSVAGDAVD